MKKSRVIKLPDAKGTILGVDMEGHLESGFIYEMSSKGNLIILVKHSESSLTKSSKPSTSSPHNEITSSGIHIYTPLELAKYKRLIENAYTSVAIPELLRNTTRKRGG